MKTQNVVVLDCDGTLFPKATPLVPYVLHQVLAKTPDLLAAFIENDRHLIQCWTDGTITPELEREWLEYDLMVLAKAGVGESDVRLALKEMRAIDGVHECLERLRAADIPVAVISYAIADFVQIALEQNGLSHLVETVYAASLTLDAHGRYVSYLPGTVVLPDNKRDWSALFAERHGCPLAGILAVGDSISDRTLGHLKENRLLIAADDAKARMLATHGETVVTDDFHPVIGWLEKKLGRKL